MRERLFIAVYIMTNAPYGTLYLGVTSNLYERVRQHRDGTFRGFTAEHGLKRLAWYQPFESMTAAIRREKSLWKGARGDGRFRFSKPFFRTVSRRQLCSGHHQRDCDGHHLDRGACLGSSIVYRHLVGLNFLGVLEIRCSCSLDSSRFARVEPADDFLRWLELHLRRQLCLPLT